MHMRKYLYVLAAAAAITGVTVSSVTAFADDPQVQELSLPSAGPEVADRGDSLSGRGVYRSESELDRARARLRDDLRQSRAADNQAIAVLNSDIIDRDTAERKTLARQAYARSGRNAIVERSLDNTHVSSDDARILSEWARDQKFNENRKSLSSSDEDSRRMIEQYRKRYPSSEAAKAMQSWISTGDVSSERKEAREVLKSRNKKN